MITGGHWFNQFELHSQGIPQLTAKGPHSYASTTARGLKIDLKKYLQWDNCEIMNVLLLILPIPKLYRKTCLLTQLNKISSLLIQP